MNKRVTCLAMTALLALSWSACGDDEEQQAGPQLSAVSYNLGLAVGFVTAAEERAPVTIQATADLDADVVCVQEVWLPRHVDALKQATASSHPHSVFIEADAGMMGAAACGPTDADELLTCVTNNGCDQVCSDELVDCVLANCLTELGALPQACNMCIQANVGQPLEDIEANCETGTTEYAFGGSFGIGLLSKYPILNQETKVLDSTTNRRGVVYAELDTPLGPVHTFCTHLTAVFSTIPYPKATGSWEEEQAAQIAELIDMANSKAGSDGQLIVMGDMNTGPAGSGYDAEVVDNYNLFTAAGWASPYADAGQPCTYCETNPLLEAGDGNVVIDHIFTQNLPGTVSASRVADGSVEVTSCDKPITAAYSDHYGVRVNVER